VAVFLCPFPGLWCWRTGVGVLGQVEFVQQLHGGDGHKKGCLNKVTTKSGVATNVADDSHEGVWDTVKRQMGPGQPGLSLEALWGRAVRPCSQAVAIILCSWVAPSESSCLDPQVR
jgi:hypothetical protein